MKKKELLSFYNGVSNGNLNGLKGVVFTHGVFKNKNLFHEEADSLNEAIKPSKEYDKIERERAAKAVELSDKDKSGSPVIINGEYSFNDDNAVKFKKYYDGFLVKNKEVIEEREAQIKDFADLLEEEVDSTIKIHKIKPSDVPKDILMEQMNLIFFMIK
tara:strand:+ start:975 stop:1451 length:477 start_codon:yes stop_codon:yes gene_type:complete